MKKKTLLSLILTLSFILGAMLFTTVVSQATTIGYGYTGSQCTSDTTAASVIDYVMNKYKQDSVYPNGGECWGYAETVRELLADTSSTTYYNSGLSFNKNNFRNKCLNVRAGTHLRLSRNKEFNAWSGHSIVLFKVTDKQVCWADNNYQWDNTVCYYTGTLDEFIYRYNQYGYINMVSKPTKYETYSTPLLSAGFDSKAGGNKLTWTRTTNTQKYEIYRSYSKDSGYSRIAQVTSARNYTDKSAALGKTAYYKVKAVKSSGNKYSGVTSCTRKLAVPSVSSGNDSNGYITLKWNAVSGANRYSIYRQSPYTGDFVKIKTTTSTSYTDKTATGWIYAYKIRAEYTANSSANSGYAFVNAGYDPDKNPNFLPATTVKTANDSNGKIQLTWEDVAGAYEYEVYRAASASGTYSLIGTAYYTDFTDTSTKSGQTYYYKVRASKYDVKSAYSTAVKATDTSIPVLSNLTIKSGNAASGKPKLTWNKVSGATKYEIYRSGYRNGTYSKMFTTTNTSYTNTSAKAGYTYFYKVRVISGSKIVGESRVIGQACVEPILPKTVKVTKSNAASGKPKLTWNKVSGATKYEVYRSGYSNGTYTKMYTTTNTSYTNTSAKTGYTYFYKVKALNGSTPIGESEIIKQSCISPVVPDNIPVTAGNSTSGKPKLTWNKVSGATKYEVYRSGYSNGTYTKMYTTTNTSYTNTSAKSGYTYFYKVKAVGTEHPAESDIISVKCR